MANYPNSVWSPSAKSNGQTIDASHINDIQDEVVALEDGLRNATAPLASSRSTVAALSVVGGSTFGARPVEPPPHMVLVFRETTHAMGSSVASTITWNAQSILTNSSMHSTGTNPERLTPQSTGVYRIAAHVSFIGNSSGDRYVQIRDSSGVSLATGQGRSGSANNLRVQVECVKRFDALGGYVICHVENEGASTMSVSSGLGETWMSLEKL